MERTAGPFGKNKATCFSSNPAIWLQISLRPVARRLTRATGRSTRRLINPQYPPSFSVLETEFIWQILLRYCYLHQRSSTLLHRLKRIFKVYEITTATRQFSIYKSTEIRKNTFISFWTFSWYHIYQLLSYRRAFSVHVYMNLVNHSDYCF